MLNSKKASSSTALCVTVTYSQLLDIDASTLVWYLKLLGEYRHPRHSPEDQPTFSLQSLRRRSGLQTSTRPSHHHDGAACRECLGQKGITGTFASSVCAWAKVGLSHCCKCGMIRQLQLAAPSGAASPPPPGVRPTWSRLGRLHV